MEIVVPLVFVHGLVDLVGDLLLDPHHLALPVEHLQKPVQTADEGILVHHRLFVLVAEQEVCGDVLTQKRGVAGGHDGKDHVLGQPRIHGEILVEPGFQAAEQGVHLQGLFPLGGLDRRGADGGKIKLAAGVQPGEFGAVFALHQDLHQLVGHPQHLFDLGHHAVGVEVLLLGGVGVHLLLGDEKDVGIIGHRPLHGGDALLAPHLEVNEIVRKNHQPPQGDGGQVQLVALHLNSNFFRHSVNLPADVPKGVWACGSL